MQANQGVGCGRCQKMAVSRLGGRGAEGEASTIPETKNVLFSTCRWPDCEAGIREETFDLAECGAGLRLKAECNIGHINSFSTCKFFNKKRTSVLDIKISSMKLVVGLCMTQECQQDFYIDLDLDPYSSLFSPMC